MSGIRIALAQINTTVGDLDGNVDLIVSRAEAARQAGADLVIFPELAVSGYPPEDLLHKPRFLADCRWALEEAVKRTPGVATLIGFPEADDGRVYNSAALAHGGRALGIYRKVELPNYGVFDEKRYFAPGGRPFFFELGGALFAVTICEDAWIGGGACESAIREAGADLTANLSASPFHAGKAAVRASALQRFAAATGTTVCFANLVGGQDELVFDGASAFIEADRPVETGARFEESLVLRDFSIERDRPLPSLPGLVHVALARPAADRPLISAADAGGIGAVEEVRRALVLGTRDYMRKNGFATALVGMSGGIDSSLVAALAVEALGADAVVGITMPTRFNSAETIADARRSAEALGIRFISIPIEETFGAYRSLLGGHLAEDEGGGAGMTWENIQARIRGNVLMAFSNRFGWIVLTTGNKSETAVGYSTLYGDTAGGFAVIKDVPKTVVYALARHMNASAGREVIPQSVIDRAPSAELRENQLDQDSLPPYDVLDRIIEAYVEKDMVAREIVALGFDDALVRRVVRMIDRAEYKRRQAPPGVKITPKAFGRDRRLPITNRYG